MGKSDATVRKKKPEERPSTESTTDREETPSPVQERFRTTPLYVEGSRTEVTRDIPMDNQTETNEIVPLSFPEPLSDIQSPLLTRSEAESGTTVPSIQSPPPTRCETESDSVPSIVSLSPSASPPTPLKRDADASAADTAASAANDADSPLPPRAGTVSVRSVVAGLSVVGLAMMMYRAQQEQVPRDTAPRPTYPGRELRGLLEGSPRPPLPTLRED